MHRGQALRLFGGALALWASGCSNDAAPVPKSCGTAATSTRFGATIYASDDVDRALQLIAGCGGKFVRVGVDQYQVDFTDAVLSKAALYGLRVVLISPYSEQPVNRASYATQCVAIQRRYAQYNPIWELWNEPNLAAYWGAPPNVDDYVRLAVATGTALRANGATDVWTGGTSGIDVRWSYALLQRGVFDALNGCAVHSYKDPGAASADYVALQKLLPPNIPIHTTETCVPSSLEDQSAFLSGMWYIHRALGLPTMIWCELRDFTAGDHPPYNYPYGLLWSTYRPKDAYYTAKSLTSACD
jgi:hypothetical protein